MMVMVTVVVLVMMMVAVMVTVMMAMMMMTDRSKQWRRSNYNDCYHHQPSLGHTADNSNSLIL